MVGRWSRGRLLTIWILLVMLAMLRAEQGVRELQGRKNEPSHLFRLAPRQDETGGWQLTLLGYELKLPSQILLFDRGRVPWKPGS